MNYILNTYGNFLYFIGTLVFLITLLAISVAFVFWLEKRCKLSEKLVKVLIGVAVFGSSISTYFALSYVPDYLNDGEIYRIYVLESGDEKRVVAWFTREDNPAGIGIAYSHRLKSYDLYNGNKLGRQDLSRRHWTNDYRIYGPFDDNKAWGYSEQTGVQLLDLFKPKIIADEEDILKSNPKLGSTIRILPGDFNKSFDDVTHGLYISTANGEIYRISTQLEAVSSRDIDRSKEHHSKDCIQKWTVDSELGTQSNTLYGINLRNHFSEKARPYASVLLGDELLIFMSIDGYTLSSLWANPSTGDVLGTVDYFK